MISETANQFALFTRLLFLGSAVGGAEYVLWLSGKKLSKERAFGIILAAFLAILAGIIYVFGVLSFPFAPKARYYPFVFLSGLIMGAFIIDAIVALFKNICYNMSEKTCLQEFSSEYYNEKPRLPLGKRSGGSRKR